jgi:hypothetical protein
VAAQGFGLGGRSWTRGELRLWEAGDAATAVWCRGINCLHWLLGVRGSHGFWRALDQALTGARGPGSLRPRLVAR